MANLGESDTHKSLLKLLLLGDTKAGKTHYAMQAAAAGYNVLYLDGDVAIQTLVDSDTGLSKEALSRVWHLNVTDYVDKSGNYIPFMAKFFVEFTTQGVFTWNDTQGRIFDRNTYARDVMQEDDSGIEQVAGGDEVWQIVPSRLDSNTVLIMDSWTTLVTSLQWWKANDLSIDLLEIEKMERDMYSGTAHKATQFLQLLRALPCHLIVIGHPREYKKMSVPDGSKGNVAEKDMRVDWTRMVPMSTSNPHALTMGKNFSDIGWIDISPTRERKIDFRPSTSRVIGGHSKEQHKVEEFPVDKLIQKIGAPAPIVGQTPPWLTRFGPGEFVPAGGAKKPLTGSNSSTAAPVKGLSGFAALKPKGVTKA